MSRDKQLKFVEEDIIDMEEVNEVAVTVVNTPQEVKPLGELMEMANMLSKSTIVPIEYQNRPENVVLALDMANRMSISPFVVMQQMYVINGKPSFSGQFISMIIQNNPRFEDVELIYVGKQGEGSYGAYVRAVEKSSGRELKGTTVTMDMARAEKWGPKWKTFPTQMLGYRAYTFFGRLYAPAELMGMSASDELEDMNQGRSKVVNPYDK